LALLNKGEGGNGECIFLDGRDCRVQAVKPTQCAGFPNTWNFPGWRDVCEAIPVPRVESVQREIVVDVGLGAIT
jgi:hypothetical protein